MKWRIQHNPHLKQYKIQIKSWWWLPYWTDGTGSYATLEEAREIATLAFDTPKNSWTTVFPPHWRRSDEFGRKSGDNPGP